MSPKPPEYYAEKRERDNKIRENQAHEKRMFDAQLVEEKNEFFNEIRTQKLSPNVYLVQKQKFYENQQKQRQDFKDKQIKDKEHWDNQTKTSLEFFYPDEEPAKPPKTPKTPKPVVVKTPPTPKQPKAPIPPSVSKSVPSGRGAGGRFTKGNAFGIPTRFKPKGGSGGSGGGSSNTNPPSPGAGGSGGNNQIDYTHYFKATLGYLNTISNNTSGTYNLLHQVLLQKNTNASSGNALTANGAFFLNNSLQTSVDTKLIAIRVTLATHANMMDERFEANNNILGSILSSVEAIADFLITGNRIQNGIDAENEYEKKIRKKKQKSGIASKILFSDVNPKLLLGAGLLGGGLMVFDALKNVDFRTKFIKEYVELFSEGFDVVKKLIGEKLGLFNVDPNSKNILNSLFSKILLPVVNAYNAKQAPDTSGFSFNPGDRLMRLLSGNSANKEENQVILNKLLQARKSAQTGIFPNIADKNTNWADEALIGFGLKSKPPADVTLGNLEQAARYNYSDLMGDMSKEEFSFVFGQIIKKHGLSRNSKGQGVIPNTSTIKKDIDILRKEYRKASDIVNLKTGANIYDMTRNFEQAASKIQYHKIPPNQSFFDNTRSNWTQFDMLRRGIMEATRPYNNKSPTAPPIIINNGGGSNNSAPMSYNSQKGISGSTRSRDSTIEMIERDALSTAIV